ncbi:MAG TPA: MlaD family protein [Planctomycetota bacterium]|jgi:paraquat-inducible protein B|nr:MlaD family protein [Planctomycetota bacterium]
MKSQRANPVKIGVFVVGGLVIILGAVVFIGSGRLFRRTHPFVSYFDGGVSGLRAGAPVKFKGIEVGTVDRTRILGGLLQSDQPIAVFYALDGDKLGEAGDRSGAWADTLRGAIDSGLRAQLESDSLVTGVQHVSLVFVPDAKLRLHESIEGVMEIPTIPPPLQEIGVALRSIVDRIGRYDFEKLLDSVRTALDGVADLSRAPELRSALSSLDTTLKDVDAAVGDLRAGIGEARATLGSVQGLSDDLTASLRPLLASLKLATDKLQAMAVAVEATLASTRTLLDPEAPIAVELRAGLRELADTARSTRALFELLERDPAALLRGKGAQEERPR